MGAAVGAIVLCALGFILYRRKRGQLQLPDGGRLAHAEMTPLVGNSPVFDEVCFGDFADLVVGAPWPKDECQVRRLQWRQCG